MLKNKLKLARVTQGDLTQEELAQRVKCSRQTVHSIEAGKFVPSVELALKFARALQTPLQEIFMLEDE